jgi:hypothetical protein
MFCMSVGDTVKLSRWVNDITEVRRSVSRCPLIVLE